MANTYLSRTPSTTGNTKKFTISYWIKRTGLGTEQDIFHVWSGSGSRSQIMFNSANQLKLDLENNTNNLITNRLFRDTSAWYHIVIVYDSDNSTSSDRLKIYVNGVRETSFATAQYPSSGSTSQVNTTTQHEISSYDGAGYYFEGSMSHIHFIDGTVYDATAFGEYDANGVWKINTSPSVTYGTNGFFILKDGNSVTDQSGNSNNFTVGGGTLTKTEDSPSNVFATINSLWYANISNTFSNGNLTVANGSAHRPTPPTIAPSSGKWYMEAKAVSGSSTKWWFGIADQEYSDTFQNLSSGNYLYGADPQPSGVNERMQSVYNNNFYVNGTTTVTGFFSSGAISAGDIAMLAVDLDNQKIWYGKNGVWNNGSGTESTTLDFSNPDSTSITSGRNYYINTGGENCGWSVNYGNGYFGTTAVSSAGTNASGIGIFEYDVPTGFTALSTKGLNL